jgi:DNA-binding SARP family transcriptional activator
MPVAADVFDRFPHGIVVCDPGGRVVAANPRVRLDLSTMDADGLRVATAPLHDHGSHVVLELRQEGERRHSGGALRVFALGDLRVEGPDGPLSGAWLDQRAGELLRFLVCRRGRLTPADVIAEAIWPHAGSAGTNTVRHFVHALRERLEPERPRHAASAFIECRRGGYALRADRVWIDADAFERNVRRGMAALAAGDRPEAARRLERAVALYREDFLSDEPYADWAFAERERLRAIAHDAFQGLAELHADRPAVAAMYLERLAELEPFDDDIHRQLISAWLRLGRKSRAARYYESFQVRLLREFGARPDFDLRQIACAAPARSA